MVDLRKDPAERNKGNQVENECALQVVESHLFQRVRFGQALFVEFLLEKVHYHLDEEESFGDDQDPEAALIKVREARHVVIRINDGRIKAHQDNHDVPDLVGHCILPEGVFGPLGLLTFDEWSLFTTFGLVVLMGAIFMVVV